MDLTRRKQILPRTENQDLLVPVFRQGQLVYTSPSINETRRKVQEQLGRFHSGIKRFVNPHQYPVGLEQHLHDLRTKLILKARGVSADEITQPLG
jgi:nicotinate phosphoribosyltransferase